MPISKLQESTLLQLMEAADISTVAIAEFGQGTPQGQWPSSEVASEMRFGAASLSKPVFAYLVYKLHQDPEYPAFTLDAPLYTFLENEQINQNPYHKKITARLILSHQSGWPSDNSSEFLFPPGEGYHYSGVPYGYLQKVIECITELSLDQFAKPLLDDLGMHASSFLPPSGDFALVHAANSLLTTAQDYATFCKAIVKEKDVFDIVSPLSLERDQWAANQGFSGSELKNIAWGLGWGLQLNAEGKVTHAFHYGDMNEWRAFVAIDVEKQQGIVFLANSPNGLMLADAIVSSSVELKAGLDFVFKKFGFARKIEPFWQDKQRMRIEKIIQKNQPDLWQKIQQYQSSVATKTSHALKASFFLHRRTKSASELPLINCNTVKMQSIYSRCAKM